MCVSVCVCLCSSLNSLNSLVLLIPTIHHYNTGLYLIICCCLMMFFCLDCKLLESRNSVFFLYYSCQLFLRCLINPCGTNDYEAYGLNKNYVCKLAGLRNAVGSGLSIYGFSYEVRWKNPPGGMPFGPRAPSEVWLRGCHRRDPILSMYYVVSSVSERLMSGQKTALHAI